MRPFFISLVSDSKSPMFISSNGGLSAGRKDCDNALFPYYTDDKITESSRNYRKQNLTSNTIRKIKPFYGSRFLISTKGFIISSQIYKNTFGNKIIFEEINTNLNSLLDINGIQVINLDSVKKLKIH